MPGDESSEFDASSYPSKPNLAADWESSPIGVACCGVLRLPECYDQRMFNQDSYTRRFIDHSLIFLVFSAGWLAEKD